LAAARFTRDPLSLAEALRIIERHPGGAGYIPEGLAPMCIRETRGGLSGPLASWRRTHLPIAERINMLLALANVSPADFDRQVGQAAEHFEQREHWTSSPIAVAPSMVTGMPPVAERNAGVTARRASTVRAAVTSDSAVVAGCPTCGVSLREVEYEGVRIVACGSCGGCLVSDDALKRVLARRDVGFTDDQRRLAERIATSGDQQRRAVRSGQSRSDGGLIRCPRCARTMMRGHFNYEHALEVDRCAICDLVWFGRDEFEVLQILTERQVD